MLGHRAFVAACLLLLQPTGSQLSAEEKALRAAGSVEIKYCMS